jgi:Tol biopolymer transport system component
MKKSSMGTALFAFATAAAIPAQQIERVTVTSGGLESHGLVDSPSISADGRFVAFSSEATDLVPNDLNGVADVFVRDRVLGTTERVSVALAAGAEADGRSFHSALSGDGRYVAFTSAATNLTNNPDFNGGLDVFVHDRTTHTTRLVSIGHPSGTTAGMTASGGSWSPAISADGRWVVFYSGAGDLLAPGLDANVIVDAFVADLSNSTMTRISVSSAGAAADWHCGVSYELPGGTSISNDGRFAVFTSEADNLVPNAISGLPTTYVRDLVLGTTDIVAYLMNGTPSLRESPYPAISADGRFVVFYSGDPNLVPGDSGNTYDAFVRDLVNATTERVSVNSLGVPGFYSGPLQSVLVGKPSISADGRSSRSRRCSKTSCPATPTSRPTSSCAIASKASRR